MTLAIAVMPRITTIAPRDTPMGISGAHGTGSPPLMNGTSFSCSACSTSLTPMNPSSTASPMFR